jgi:hypothetical protein
VAFAAIFGAMGSLNETFGTSLVTAQQLVALSLNLCGAFFFATYKHEMPSETMANLGAAESLPANGH